MDAISSLVCLYCIVGRGKSVDPNQLLHQKPANLGLHHYKYGIKCSYIIISFLIYMQVQGHHPHHRMLLNSPNLAVKSIIFPQFNPGAFPKIAGKSRSELIFLRYKMLLSSILFVLLCMLGNGACFIVVF